MVSGLSLLFFDSTNTLASECLVLVSTGKTVCGFTFNYPSILAGILLTIAGASVTVPFAVSQVMRLGRHGILSSKNERRIMIASAVAIVAFLFFVPVVQTTAPPPTYHPSCHNCAPFIAVHVYGSTTYWFFGYGGILPGHYGDFRYYSVVWS